jgi:hypothetical protein
MHRSQGLTLSGMIAPKAYSMSNCGAINMIQTRENFDPAKRAVKQWQVKRY